MPDQSGARRRPSLRGVFVTAVVLVAGFHLVAVTAAALPPNQYSDAVKPITGYLAPYFTQNWRLFAPNPVASDRVVRFQAAIEEDGRIVTTDWIDWTAVELDLVHHRLVGNRAGYVTNKAYSSLSNRYAQLSTAQRKVTDVADPAEAPVWRDLSEELTANGGRSSLAAQGYLLYDRSVTRLATDVMAGRHPDAKIVAIRYALRGQAVTPYEARGGSKAERQAARPTAGQRINGWRRPVLGTEAERRDVADFDRRHRGDR